MLEEIGAGEGPRVLVLNKADALDADGLEVLSQSAPLPFPIDDAARYGLPEVLA